MTSTDQPSFSPLPGSQLPIFRQDLGDTSLFYAPGYLVVVPAGEIDAFCASLRGHQPGSPQAAQLLQAAAQAEQAWQALWLKPYRPVCLTLYLHNQCNLACSYCYADPLPAVSHACAGCLDLEQIRAAAELVAANCADQGLPLTVVFHGGGEPTLHRGLLQQALALVERSAARYGLHIFRYIATNGVMPAGQAAWLAQAFDQVGLSCDGPPEIQDRQRPRRDGRSSWPQVERTARILRQAGKAVHLRVTLIPQNVARLPQIVTGLCERLQPEQIRLEPVYSTGRVDHDTWQAPGLAAAFVQAFIQAQAQAQAAGVRLLTSGSRPAEVHGPYCNVFRDVLNLVPGGVATACFKTGQADQVYAAGLALCGNTANAQPGLRQPDLRQPLVDPEQVMELRRQLVDLTSQCETCFNQYHCVRGCPDRCWLEAGAGWPAFRCQVQQQLTLHELHSRAAQLLSRGTGIQGMRYEATHGN